MIKDANFNGDYKDKEKKRTSIDLTNSQLALKIELSNLI